AFLKLVSSNPTCMERGSRNGGEGEIARSGRPRLAPRWRSGPDFRGRKSVRLCPAKPSNSTFSSHVSSNLTCDDRGNRNGGEGEIRTHVPELPDHPISSRRRYDRFGTSPRAKNTHSWIRAARSGARILAEQ